MKSNGKEKASSTKPKNRVMCPDCNRQKILFETEEKALNFIKYNSKNIDSHGNPLRPYYCPACCGYHISSKPYNEKYEGRTDRLIENYKKSKAKRPFMLDKLEIARMRYADETELVNRLYPLFMNDLCHGSVKEFLKDKFPNLDINKGTIVDRMKHRQSVEALEYWRTLDKEGKNKVCRECAQEAIDMGVTTYDGIVKFMRCKHKLFPVENIDGIRRKYNEILNEMGEVL